MCDSTTDRRKGTPALATKLLHAGRGNDSFSATLPPFYQTSAFSQPSAEDMEALFAGKRPGFTYSRLGNPTINAFENVMCMAEGGVFATACASGSAAVALTMLNILSAGDEIITSSQIYGGTLDFFRDLQPLNIHVKYLEQMDVQSLSAAISENTKVVFAEIISNPGLKVLDVEKTAAVCKEKGVPLIVDATTVTPVLIQPLKLGADIVIHSSSKYINGNGSAISGVIVDGCSFDWTDDRYPALHEYIRHGKGAFSARLREAVWRDVGACLSPAHAFLNVSGLETLALRMERICENAGALAAFLERRGANVRYPGLDSHEDHALSKRQFADGMAGGIITLRLGGKAAAFRLINTLCCAKIVSNIGDTKTLVIHPASTIFAHSAPTQRKIAGVYDDLVRISVGIENIDDLIADFDQAMGRL